MLKEERQGYILEALQMHKRVLTSELSTSLAVSEDTIRRDLKELSDLGKIKKVHGGAVISSDHPYNFYEREIFALDRKILLAEKAVTQLREGMVILMDGGTTNIELAKRIPRDLSLTIFTNSLPVATELSDHLELELVFLGGRLLKNEKVTAGLEVIQALDGIYADLCILGTRSIHVEKGITENNWEETKVKRAMVERSNRLMTMVISEKWESLNPYQVVGLQQIDTLVTDLPEEHPVLTPYESLGIHIL